MHQVSFPFLPPSPPGDPESPAERAFGDAHTRTGWLEQPAPDNDTGIRYGPRSWVHPRVPATVLFSQVELEYLTGEPHRVDFAYRVYSRPVHVYAVEIDGERWHLSSQAFARDRRLDRLVQMAGDGRWQMWRFPAREVLDPVSCDAHVARIIRQLLRWSVHAQPHTLRTG
jgi:hypothetical protein